MTLTAVLSTTSLEVAPGHQAGCDVRVRNIGAEPVTVDLSLAGPAAAWAVVLPATLVVAPGGSRQSRLIIDVPRECGLAGSGRDLAVAVTARNSAAPAVGLAGRVAVVDLRDLRATFTPIVARARGAVSYTVTIANHGTGASRVELETGRTEHSAVRVRLSPAQVMVAPGDYATAEVAVRPRRPVLFGAARPHPVVVDARPEDGPPVTATATHFQEPLRWRSRAAVVAVVAVVAVLLLVTGEDPPAVPAVIAPATSTVAASACSGLDGATRVDIAGFAFCPALVTVGVGTEVVWANTDLSPHTVTFDGLGDRSDSGLLSQGQTWSRSFDHAGTYQYSCRLHPGMAGTIVVT